MHRLGGKVIPNSNPPVRFKLNHNSTRLQQGEPDTSIWVGDLTPEVDDYALYQFFTQRYQTVRCAKVVLDDSGFSKGYGFVRFGAEQEQQHALNQMSGEVGLGGKPIKVSMANQKNRSSSGSVVGQPTLHVGHQNGGAGGAPGSWAATLDVQVGRGAAGLASTEGPGGWASMQSQHWSGTPAAGLAAVPAATPAQLAAHPDFAYHQYLYAQQISQPHAYAPTWNAAAWQQGPQ